MNEIVFSSINIQSYQPEQIVIVDSLIWNILRQMFHVHLQYHHSTPHASIKTIHNTVSTTIVYSMLIISNYITNI